MKDKNVEAYRFAVRLRYASRWRGLVNVLSWHILVAIIVFVARTLLSNPTEGLQAGVGYATDGFALGLMTILWIVYYRYRAYEFSD